MTKYKITLVTEAGSAAEAAARVSMDTDGEFLAEWESITAEKVVSGYATGGYVPGRLTLSPESIEEIGKLYQSYTVKGGK